MARTVITTNDAIAVKHQAKKERKKKSFIKSRKRKYE
jgi:hypothetical protein